MSALNRLSGSNANDAVLPEAVPNICRGAVLLDRNTKLSSVRRRGGRTVRVMVTMPTEAATDYELVRDLALHGMDCMRINCAHWYIVTAVRTLDDILRRMQSHQEKKRSMLRKLNVASAFRSGAAAAP
jgi:hypothetical protein